MNDTPNTDNGSKITTEITCYAKAMIINVLKNAMMMMTPLAAMTDLEMWTFCCIVSVFVSLVSYGIILVKDQMIIQVEIL